MAGWTYDELTGLAAGTLRAAHELGWTHWVMPATSAGDWEAWLAGGALYWTSSGLVYFGERALNAAIERVEERFADDRPGRWAWVLEDPQPLEPPLEASGQRKLWDVELERPTLFS